MSLSCKNIFVLLDYSDSSAKCWVVTHRAAFMGTVAGLGVIGVSSGVVRMVYG